MPRKISTDSNKKEEILAAALNLFLENGYEQTSVRMISQTIGCEVGLIYYYFKTKDDLFENALSLYFKKFEEELMSLPCEADVDHLIDTFVEYMERKAAEIRENFANTHFTVRAAIHEKIKTIAESYLSEGLQQAEQKNACVLAAFLSQGLCGAMLKDDASFYEINKENVIRTSKSLCGVKESVGKKKDIPSFLL